MADKAIVTLDCILRHVGMKCPSRAEALEVGVCEVIYKPGMINDLGPILHRVLQADDGGA